VLLIKDGERRFLEIVKLRGKGFPEGAHSMEILESGVHVYPKIRYARPSSALTKKETFGIQGVDDLLGGGIISGDITLLSGSPGSGKTLFGLQFMKAGLAKREKVLYITFKETRAELVRNAKNWGLDLGDLTKKGLVHIMDTPIIDLLPNRHLEELRKLAGKADRVIIDSINDYEKALTHPRDVDFRRYAEWVVGILKEQGVTSLILSDSQEIIGTTSFPAENYIMHLADNIILLRYLEYKSEFKRIISVLKKRSGTNSQDIREFSITKNKVTIGDVLEGIDGIMSGKATRSGERIERFFS